MKPTIYQLPNHVIINERLVELNILDYIINGKTLDYFTWVIANRQLTRYDIFVTLNNVIHDQQKFNLIDTGILDKFVQAIVEVSDKIDD